MTNELQNTIGSQILSIVYGVGVVAAIEKLQADGADFYVVEFIETSTKNYFPINETKKIRFISNQTDFESNLEKLKVESEPCEFESRKDRITYFNALYSDCNLDVMVSKIKQINSLNDLMPNEKEKLQKLIDLLEVEAGIIYKTSPEEAKSFVSKYLS